MAKKVGMAAAPRDLRRRRVRAPGAIPAASAEDDEEEQHLNPFLSDEAPSSSRIQFRNVASRARWVEEAGEAEVVDRKGKLWLTTGVTRGGKLCYNVEEIGRKEEIKSYEERVKNLLEMIPPKGKEFLQSIEHILEREKNRVWWKRDGYLPFEKTTF